MWWQARRAQQGGAQQGPRRARRHLHRAGARLLPRPRGLAQEGRRHRRQGPGQVRLLLGLQYRESHSFVAPIMFHTRHALRHVSYT